MKPILVARFARGPGAPADARSTSTPRSRRTSSTPPAQPDDRRRRRRAARPRSCRRRRSCRRPARAGLEALSALAVRDPLARRSSDEGARPAVPRDRAAADPGARPDGGDRRRPRPRGARRLDREFRAEIARLEREIYASVGHEFTIGTPKQLEQVLFDELNLPKGKRTKTGYSTDASVLEELAGGAPDGRAAARVADLHEAPLDLRRGAADADRPPTAGCTRPSTRRSRRPAACRRPTRTSRTSRSGRRSAGGSGARSWPARRT